MLTLQEIIARADGLVDNAVDADDKLAYLSDLNREFFELVKIPVIYPFNIFAGLDVYTLPTAIRSKNIDSIATDVGTYESYSFEGGALVGRNAWIMDDATGQLTLTPEPYDDGIGRIRYFKRAAIFYTAGTALSTVPEVPEEYQGVLVHGLCEKLAKAMDDDFKGSNYNREYQNGLLIAQQNYGKGG